MLFSDVTTKPQNTLLNYMQEKTDVLQELFLFFVFEWDYRTFERVRVLCRPWRTPEGAVNRPALQLMLEAVCMRVMMAPGTTMTSLAHKFSPAVQPVVLTELVEVGHERSLVLFDKAGDNIIVPYTTIIL